MEWTAPTWTAEACCRFPQASLLAVEVCERYTYLLSNGMRKPTGFLTQSLTQCRARNAFRDLEPAHAAPYLSFFFPGESPSSFFSLLPLESLGFPPPLGPAGADLGLAGLT